MSQVDLIERWAVALCRMDDLPLAAAAEALGVTGPFVVNLYGSDHFLAESPPPGIARLELSGRSGVLYTMTVSLDEGDVLVADLDRRFGAYEPVAHMPDARHSTIRYGVAVPDASHACAMFADLRYGPAPTSSVFRVLLRRDPASAWAEPAVRPGGRR